MAEKECWKLLILTPRNVSSVGSERCFDRAEVTGSSPVRSTRFFYLPCSGTLAQLVQSAAFTQQRSLVRVQCVPPDSLCVMAFVYILYSAKLDRFYTGSCQSLEERLFQHHTQVYKGSYTHKATDWEIFYFIADLMYEQAGKIERHIKRMKSRIYIRNLKKHPEISQRLVQLYS